MNKNYILQIETATPACSVAVSLDGHVITTVGAEENNIHATHLTVFIEKALQNAGITVEDLSAVAVSMGPDHIQAYVSVFQRQKDYVMHWIFLLLQLIPCLLCSVDFRKGS
ncbi:hypothetical protein HMPREF0765_2557 [Sphingobacterium spiritivorum ATCC 33300]|uniref:Uncharacterized protein n=1 Tax=Sphingobacterium spiritivorum ATCC 33300 TaxID=525372 RepID=C2FZ01_SPHSI|nr:hypothetical protein [Sphingobacterium spiritivorum]EEI91843.1 hypothetical protein HMPREF0765_2557 [Sphingobacterium spiritivorum ATCC 33300]